MSFIYYSFMSLLLKNGVQKATLSKKIPKLLFIKSFLKEIYNPFSKVKLPIYLTGQIVIHKLI